MELLNDNQFFGPRAEMSWSPLVYGILSFAIIIKALQNFKDFSLKFRIMFIGLYAKKILCLSYKALLYESAEFI